MSGRREPQVHEAARLMGQTSYIYEAGCAFAIDGETTLLTGEMVPDEDGTDLRADRGSAASRSCSSSTSRGGSSTTRPGTTAASSPTSSAARSTSTRPTRCSASDGHDDLRLLDNGAIGREMPAIEGRTHAYHLVPKLVSKARRRRRPRPRPRLRPGRLHRGRRLGRGPRGRRRGRPLLRRRQRPRARPRPARRARRAGTTPRSPRAAMGDGFYEAVVSTLIERR